MKKIKQKSAYDQNKIELKWQAVWDDSALYQPDLANAKKPFFNLMMFPYPSAEGLHVGSVYAFGGADVYARFKRMQGNDVFEPIGLDGFGIHSENHAIKTNSHPMEHAKRTEENFYRQLHSIGNSFTWKNKLETYDPHYYKWTQWLFTELFKAGLAYRKKSAVNFCPWCKTVLADEQVIDAKCERCGTVVEKRDLEQWFFKITDYAEQLLKNIDGLDWTEKVKIAQRNWIGKSEGVVLTFTLDKYNDSLRVFTTAIDTVHGVTFMVVAPEHPLVKRICDGEFSLTENTIEAVKRYKEDTNAKSQIERQAEGKEKSGVFSGLFVINPLNGEKIPLWVADYVLMDYGTGVVMGVPAHDSRDHEFAEKYNLSVKQVIKPTQNLADAHVGEDGFWDYKEIKTLFRENSIVINSGDLNNLSNKAAKEKVIKEIEKKGYGEKQTTYHLRDWLISRQRYWGSPIPMIHCEACAKKGKSWFTTDEAKNYQESGIPTKGTDVKNQELERKQKTDSLFLIHNSKEMVGWYPVSVDNLPVELPYIEDYKPVGTGKSPLANSPEFYEVKCPGCGNMARRETDVSDTFLDSAWYFFRYLSVDRDDIAFDIETAKKWLPVNVYIGGAEHSVLHLLYARFITMVLFDLDYIKFEEPFSKFFAHGLIIKDGAKMSKSKGNVINPDEYIQKFGADALRCYLMFLGPFDQGGDFKDTGIEGMSRFLKRVRRLINESGVKNPHRRDKGEESGEATKESVRMMHQAVKSITEDMEVFHYNTAIAKLMSWYNFLVKQKTVSNDEVKVYLQLIAPFAPHMTEELWQQIGEEYSIHTSQYPVYDPKFLEIDAVTIAVQINGKLRATLTVSKQDSSEQKFVEELARKDKKIENFLSAGIVKKVVYIQGKVINFVVTV